MSAVLAEKSENGSQSNGKEHAEASEAEAEDGQEEGASVAEVEEAPDFQGDGKPRWVSGHTSLKWPTKAKEMMDSSSTENIEKLMGAVAEAQSAIRRMVTDGAVMIMPGWFFFPLKI